jgi:aldehyde dehydrogenase (NAD+)
MRLFNSGQDCLGPDAVFVAEPVLEPFVDQLVARLERLRFGPYRDAAADYGPISYDGALADVAQVLHRYQSLIRHGGTVDFRSRRVVPTVLVSRLGEEPEPTEFFAPVFNVVSYQDESALVRTLTATGYADRALGASVYGDGGGTGKLTAALRRRHTVTVDEPLTAVDDGNRAFGGWGPIANHVSYRGQRRAQPILMSQTVAEFWRAG